MHFPQPKTAVGRKIHVAQVPLPLTFFAHESGEQIGNHSQQQAYNHDACHHTCQDGYKFLIHRMLLFRTLNGFDS